MRHVADVVPASVVQTMERSVAACLTGDETAEGVEWPRAAWALGYCCQDLLDEALTQRLIVAWISGGAGPADVAQFAPRLAVTLRSGLMTAVQVAEVLEALCRAAPSAGDLSTVRTSDGCVFLAEVVAR